MKIPLRWCVALLASVVVAAAGWPVATAQQPSPTPAASAFVLPTDGKTMPEVSMADLDNLIKGHGKQLLVLNLWATWCAPCVKELPHFAEADLAFRDRGVQFVGLSLDAMVEDDWRPVSAKTAADKGVKYPIVGLPASIGSDEFVPFFSPEWSGAIPATFFYDASGKKVAEVLGEMTKEELVAQIEKLLGQGDKGAASGS